MPEGQPVQAPDQSAGDAGPAQQALQPVQQQQAQPEPVVQPGEGTPAQAPAATDWEKRFKGQQATVQHLAEQVKALSGQAAESQQYAATLETQLSTAVTQLQESVANQEQLIATAKAAQVESQFSNLLISQYPDLIGIAGGLQRVEDPEQQKQILDGVRAGLQKQATAVAQQQIQQQFAGGSPGAAATAGGGAGTLPSYGEVMEHVMDDDLAKNNPEEYQKWYDIYQNHPEMGYQSLGLGPFVDQFQNHYHSTAAAHGVQQPGAGAPGRPSTAGALDTNTPIQGTPFLMNQPKAKG